MFFRMVYKSGQIFLPFCHNPRGRQTDRQTDGQTEIYSQYHVCITCSAVKINCGRWGYLLWSTLDKVDMVFVVADMFRSDIVCGRYMDVIFLPVIHLIFLHFCIFNCPDINWCIIKNLRWNICMWFIGTLVDGKRYWSWKATSKRVSGLKWCVEGNDFSHKWYIGKWPLVDIISRKFDKNTAITDGWSAAR